MAGKPKTAIIKTGAKQLDLFAPVEVHAERIDKAKVGMAKSILVIGAELAKAHEKLAHHGNGVFRKWVEERCNIAPSSARRMMYTFEVFGQKECANLAQTFADSAMYLLAAPNTPREALDAAIARAESGEKITHKIAKEIVSEYKADPPEEPFNLEKAESKLRDTIHKLLEQWPDEHLEQAKYWLSQIAKGVS